jgi:hypothetical protein
MVATKTKKMCINLGENNREVKDTINSILGLVQVLAGNHTKTVVIIVIYA